METRREQIVVDPQKCTACHQCTMACAMKHYGRINPQLARIKIIELKDQKMNVPVICMACEDAPCIKVCPMNARVRLLNGAVVTNTDVCIGCRACIYICPAAAPAVNPYTGRTMTCDLCEGDDTGPWCVTACKDQGALKICKTDEALMEKTRKQAARTKKIYTS